MSCGADVSAAFLSFVVDGKIGGETPAPRKAFGGVVFKIIAT
jgi:hypothetical protein